mmetsp:Transcript_19074/g.44863  ORF Transcript_19074/g.44863 Transcript_19074/m.44863 type:complete len:273 (-) Transcript_19074:314-1132(-)
MAAGQDVGQRQVIGTPKTVKMGRVGAKASSLEMRHDWVNVVMLCMIFAMAAGSLSQGEDSLGHTAVVVCASVYLVFDIVWVAMQPAIVRTPRTIIAHHMITLVVICGTVENARHRVNASRALLVEINTVLLTMRRRLGRPVWCEVVFYVSWVVLRLLWFPMLGVAMLASTFGFGERLRAVAPACLWVDVRSPPPIKAYASLCFAAVVSLQFYWTASLLGSLCRRGVAGAEMLLDGPRGPAPAARRAEKRRRLLLPLAVLLLTLGLLVGLSRQ